MSAEREAGAPGLDGDASSIRQRAIRAAALGVIGYAKFAAFAPLYVAVSSTASSGSFRTID